jgi:O-antigen ligase
MPLLFLSISIIFGAITWNNISRGMLLLTALLPSYLLRTQIVGVPTTLLESLLLTFILVWAIKRYPEWRQKAFWKSKALLPLGLLLLASTISIVIAPSFVAAAGILKAYFLEPIAIFFIVSHEIKENKFNPASFFNALNLTALIVSFFGIIQWVTNAGIPIPWDIENRITSIFDYPNAVGLFLGPIVIINILRIYEAHKNEERKAFARLIITTTLAGITILLAQSEAAVVAVIATAILIGLSKKATRKKTLIASLLVATILLVSPLRNFTIEKLTLQDYSGSVRLTQWSETAQLLKDEWLLGAGLSGYSQALIPYHQATHIEIFQYPHNILLNIWVELGLLGVIATTLLGITVLRNAFSKLEETTPQIIAGFALIQMCIHGLVDVPYFKNDLALLTWILIAIALSSYASKTIAKQKYKG